MARCELWASCFRGHVDLSGSSWTGVVDPGRGGGGLKGESERERGAKKFCGLRRVAAHQRSSKKRAQDGTNGGNRQSDGVAANHPFAMLGELMPQRVPKRFRQRNQKKASEERDGGFLVEAADGLSEGELQAADPHDGAGHEKDATRPAVNLWRERRPRANCSGPQN